MTSTDTSFAEFVRDRSPALYRYAFVLTGNRYDADDLVQEALIRLRRAWPRVQRRDDPTGYVRTTMARLHISTWRRRRRELLRANGADGAVDDGAADRAAEHDEMWQALAALPPRQRAVLVLRYYEQQTDDEIAQTLNISRGTVRSQASRALAKIRADLTLPTMHVPTGSPA